MAKERITVEQQQKWAEIKQVFLSTDDATRQRSQVELEIFSASFVNSSEEQKQCKNIVLASILMNDTSWLQDAPLRDQYARELRDLISHPNNKDQNLIWTTFCSRDSYSTEDGASKLKTSLANFALLVDMVKNIKPAKGVQPDSDEYKKYSVLLEEVANLWKYGILRTEDQEHHKQWVNALLPLLEVNMFKDSAGPSDSYNIPQCFGTIILRGLLVYDGLADAVKKHAITAFKEHGCNLEADSGSGHSDLLFWLLHEAKVDLVEHLLQSGVRVQSGNYGGPGTSITPFQWFFPHNERRLGGEENAAALLKLKRLAAQYDAEHFTLNGEVLTKKLHSSDQSTSSAKPVMIGAGIGFLAGGAVGSAGEAIAQNYGTSALSQILSDLSPELKIVVVAVGGAVIGALLGCAIGGGCSRGERE